MFTPARCWGRRRGVDGLDKPLANTSSAGCQASHCTGPGFLDIRPELIVAASAPVAGLSHLLVRWRVQPTLMVYTMAYTDG